MINVDKYESRGFHNWQIEEIKLAIKNGVSDELIEEYMEDVDLNSYQLQQIRLGLQEGLDVSLYARKNIPYDEMEVIRLQQLEEKIKKQDEENEKVKEQIKIEKKEIRKGRLEGVKSFLTILLILVIFAGLSFGAYLFRDTIAKYFDELDLELSSNSIELEYGSKFDPNDYVVKATDGEEIIQIWPSFSADELGEFNLQYVITNNVRAVKRRLKVKVVDSTEPIIKLSDKNVTLTRNVDDFNGFRYIDSVSDNYDPSPKVEIGQIDWSKSKQDIEYKVTDSSGNVSTAILSVNIKNKVVISNTTSDNTDSTSTTSNSASSTTTNSNTSSGNSNSGNSTSSGGESYTIDYEDYQPSNGQYDITITDNNTGQSTTVTNENPPAPGSSNDDAFFDWINGQLP